jgi:hypothetical protein
MNTKKEKIVKAKAKDVIFLFVLVLASSAIIFASIMMAAKVSPAGSKAGTVPTLTLVVSNNASDAITAQGKEIKPAWIVSPPNLVAGVNLNLEAMQTSDVTQWRSSNYIYNVTPTAKMRNTTDNFALNMSQESTQTGSQITRTLRAGGQVIWDNSGVMNNNLNLTGVMSLSSFVTLSSNQSMTVEKETALGPTVVLKKPLTGVTLMNSTQMYNVNRWMYSSLINSQRKEARTITNIS